MDETMLRSSKETVDRGATHALSSDPFDLGADPAKQAAPTEFRIFRAGVNTSSKGDFLFDDKAAESVMRAFREKGATLTMDYEHQALAYPPVEAPASASSWVPEIRSGELWATRVNWTDRARRLIESREYTRFSPAFATDKSNRITRIVNCALTNTEALNHIEPLVAATTNHHLSEGSTMKKCTACSEEIKDDDHAMHTACAGRSGLLSALSVMGLKADAKESDLVVKLSEMRGFQDAIFALTAKTAPGDALAVLNAWKANGDQIVQLTERIEKQAVVTLRATAEGLVKGAVDEGKIAPAARDIAKITDDMLAPYLGLTAGKLDERVITALKTDIAGRSKIVSTDKTKENEGGVIALTAEDKHMAAQMGVSEEDMRKTKAAAAAQGAR